MLWTGGRHPAGSKLELARVAHANPTAPSPRQSENLRVQDSRDPATQDTCFLNFYPLVCGRVHTWGGGSGYCHWPGYSPALLHASRHPPNTPRLQPVQFRRDATTDPDAVVTALAASAGRFLLGITSPASTATTKCEGAAAWGADGMVLGNALGNCVPPLTLT